MALLHVTGHVACCQSHSMAPCMASGGADDSRCSTCNSTTTAAALRMSSCAAPAAAAGTAVAATDACVTHAHVECAHAACDHFARCIMTPMLVLLVYRHNPIHSFCQPHAPCICKLQEALLLTLLQQAHIRLAPYCRRQCVSARGEHLDNKCHCGYKDGYMRIQTAPVLPRCRVQFVMSPLQRNATTV